MNSATASSVLCILNWKIAQDDTKGCCWCTATAIQNSSDPKHDDFPKAIFRGLEQAQQRASASQFEHPCWNQSFTKPGKGTQLQKGIPAWAFSSLDGCSFQQSIGTCHRASRKKILKALVTESKASGCSCRAWTCCALTTTKHCDCAQSLAGNMAR